MKLIKTVTVIVAALLVASFTAFAEKETQDAEKIAPVELKNQTHCPVMGGKIDSTVYTDIQGQRVYHCCPMCSSKLKADPDKFFKKAAADGILYENIQTTCPVSGKELKDKSVFIDFEGRRIAFCCENCPATFKGDAQKYLSKMDAPAKEEKSDKGHEGHNH
jgi:YHS domain-containing protein